MIESAIYTCSAVACLTGGLANITDQLYRIL